MMKRGNNSRVVTALLAPVIIAGCDQARQSDVDRAAIERPPHTAVIDGARPTCEGCRIDVLPAIQLGTPRDEHIPQRVPEIVRDGRGRHYLVFNGWSNKPILRYDSGGRYVGRLGRYGKGPGEYTMTHTLLVGPGDSVFLFDWDLRGLVYDADGKFARGIRAPGATGVFGISPNGSIYTTSSAIRWEDRQPHVIRRAPDWTALDSFAVFAPVIGKSLRRSGSREAIVPRRLETLVALAPDGSVWSMGQNNYRLERHGPDGVSQQVIGIRLPDRPPLMTVAEADSVAANQPLPRPLPRRPVRPPPPRIRSHYLRSSLAVDSAGFLWVMHVLPAPRNDTITLNAQYLSPDEAPDEATIPREIEDRLYATVIDVIDPRGPALIARVELPFLGHPAAAGYVGRVTQDVDGHYISLIYRLVLRRSTTPPA